MKQRKSNYELLSEFLSKVDKIRVLPQPQMKLNYCHYCKCHVGRINCRKRPQIMAHLKQEGIGTSIYYPQPVPRMKLRKYGYDSSIYKNAATISDHSIALPVGPHLDQSDMELIAKNLIQILKNI